MASRIRSKFIEDVWVGKTIELVNGAILSRVAPNCAVCVGRDEEVEPAVYMVTYQGQVVNLCKAHAQQLLDGNEDQKQKGDIFKEVFEK